MSPWRGAREVAYRGPVRALTCSLVLALAGCGSPGDDSSTAAGSTTSGSTAASTAGSTGAAPTTSGDASTGAATTGDASATGG